MASLAPLLDVSLIDVIFSPRTRNQDYGVRTFAAAIPARPPPNSAASKLVAPRVTYHDLDLPSSRFNPRDS